MAKPPPIAIPTEPLGSTPRPVDLIERVSRGDREDPHLAPIFEDAIRDTVQHFEATGCQVVTDGEQRKYQNFATCPVHGLLNNALDGFKIPSSDGHTRRLPRLTRGPLRYRRYADSYLDVAMRCAHVPEKQAVIPETGSSGFGGSHCSSRPRIETPDEVRRPSFPARIGAGGRDG